MPGAAAAGSPRRMIAALDRSVARPSCIAKGGRRLVEQARERVAALVGAEPRNVVFTSGGTEAACWR
jgi:cysteine desulfurase